MTYSRLTTFILIATIVLASTLLGSQLLKNILPYAFSNQWRPTAENLNATGEYNPVEEEGVFEGKKVKSSNITGNFDSASQVLGDTDQLFKHIEVDLTNQKVYAFEGQTMVMQFLVSTGKWGRTPTGHFRIEYKTLAQKMSGGNKALEIPWGRGFSFHGAYWHDNFGHPMSHGCINMRNEDAEQLFYWTTPNMGDSRIVKATAENSGTPVFIYGEAPIE